MAICIKASAEHVPPGEAVFFRSFFAIPVIVVARLDRRTEGRVRYSLPDGPRLARPGRGLVDGVGVHRARPPAAAGGDGDRLCGAAPHRHLRRDVPRRAGARLPALGGVLRAGRGGDRARPAPDSDQRRCGLELYILGAMAALARGGLRRAGPGLRAEADQYRATSTIVFYFSVTASVLALVTPPWGWVVPRAGEAVTAGRRGLLGGIGQILLTESYRHAETGVIAPFEYVSMLWRSSSATSSSTRRRRARC